MIKINQRKRNLALLKRVRSFLRVAGISPVPNLLKLTVAKIFVVRDYFKILEQYSKASIIEKLSDTHLSRKGTFLNLASALCIFFILISVCGCAGGGTIGTSQTRPTRVAGIIKDPEGNPAENIIVTLMHSGDSARSDSSGLFVLESELPENNGKMQFLVEGENFEDVVTLEQPNTENLNQPLVPIKVELEVNINIGSAELTSFEVEQRETEPVSVQPGLIPSDDTQKSPTPSNNAKPSGNIAKVLPSLIQGKILNSSGEGILGVPIYAVQKGRNIGRNITKSDGSFRFEASYTTGNIEIVVGRLISPSSIIRTKLSFIPAIIKTTLVLKTSDISGTTDTNSNATDFQAVGTVVSGQIQSLKIRKRK
jgi:hypothetical protein